MSKETQDKYTLSRIADCDNNLKAMRKELEDLQHAVDLEVAVRATLVKALGHEPPKIATPPAARSVRRQKRRLGIKTKANGSTGFADLVKDMIRGKAMFSREVTEAVQKSGFNYTGTTKLSVRVGNELARLNRTGVMKRDSEGRYALA